MNDVAKAKYFDKLKKIKNRLDEARNRDNEPVPLKLHKGIYRH